MEPTLLQYKVLIHLDEIFDYTAADKPLFLGASSGSEQSRLPDDVDGTGMGGGSGITAARRDWRFGVRDVRGSSESGRGGGAGSDRAAATTGQE